MKVHKYLILLLAIPLLLSGCLINPVTGKLGPSWDLPLRIPLIHETIVLGDQLESVDRDEENGLFYLSFSETQSISIDDLDIELSSIELTGFDYEMVPGDIELSISTHLPDFDYKQVNFAAGKLVIESSIIKIDSVKICDQQLTPINSSTNQFIYQLDNVSFKANSEIEIEGKTSTPDPDLDNAAITLSFKDLELEEVTGVIERTKVDIGNHSFNTDLDWPEALDDLDLKLAGASLALSIQNNTGVEIDLNEINIIAETNKGAMPLTITDGFGIVPAHTANTLNFTASNSNINDILNARPTNIEFKGDIYAGNDQKTTFNFSEADIDITFEVLVQSIFEIEPGGFVYNSEPQKIDIPIDALDSLEDLTNDTLVFNANVKNGLPIGAAIELRLSTSENVWDDPDAAVFDFEISSEEAENNIILPVDHDTREILRTGAYAEMQVAIPNEGSEPLLVSLRATDNLTATAWVELIVKVNK